eukprot:735173-Pyramimonas_sp.AAC.1
MSASPAAASTASCARLSRWLARMSASSSPAAPSTAACASEEGGDHIPAVRTNQRREESIFPQSEPIREGKR